MAGNSRKIRGRGTANRVDARYLDHQREAIHDDWDNLDEETVPGTSVSEEQARSIITSNSSPDLPFELSINPYRGCEHGCSYCYARPSHAYLDLSPGIDFETKLFAKVNAAEVLCRQLANPGYLCRPIAMGTNTDPYQPVERDYRITRAVIEVLNACNHPLSIVTKSRLIQRDIDLLAQMAEKKLVNVFVSITSLDGELSGKLEPRASAPQRRLETLRALHEAGIPVGLMFAPVIPWVNDAEMEQVLKAAADAGARTAGYVILRLPHEVKTLFREWLELHVPLKKDHVMSIINDMRGGRDNNATFHTRMRGTGVYAAMIKKRFQHSCKVLGLNRGVETPRSDLFRPPVLPGTQQNLF